MRPLFGLALYFALIDSVVRCSRHLKTGLDTLETQCKPTNDYLEHFLREKIQTGAGVHPGSTSYESFLQEIKASLDAHMLPERAITYLFSNATEMKPTCTGDWMEFGVAYGGTINLAASWRHEHCGHCPHVHGFDTFTGLPEHWKRDDHSQYTVGSFDLDGNFPGVGPNVHLVKGLFNESIPKHLEQEAVFGVAEAPLSFLHIDCDLYGGAADVFKLLGHKIVPGTIIVFDDIVNYQYYKEGEMKAWWEFLQASGAKFATIGMLGPLPDKNYAMELNIRDGAHDWFYQSAAFVILSVPGKEGIFEERPHATHRRHQAYHLRK